MPSCMLLPCKLLLQVTVYMQNECFRMVYTMSFVDTHLMLSLECMVMYLKSGLPLWNIIGQLNVLKVCHVSGIKITMPAVWAYMYTLILPSTVAYTLWLLWLQKGQPIFSSANRHRWYGLHCSKKTWLAIGGGTIEYTLRRYFITQLRTLIENDRYGWVLAVLSCFSSKQHPFVILLPIQNYKSAFDPIVNKTLAFI